MNSQDLDRWWDRVHGTLVELLYRHDPGGMGSSVAAPADEYFDEATEFMRRLIGRAGGPNVRSVALEMWPTATPELVSELERVWSPPAPWC